MTALALALSMFYNQQIIDLTPVEMRESFDTWLVGHYPDPQHALARQLDNDGSGRCERLCLKNVELPEYNQ